MIDYEARLQKREREMEARTQRRVEEAEIRKARETARETAERLIKKGKMSIEDIADCVPALSFEELKEIEAELMQSV